MKKSLILAFGLAITLGACNRGAEQKTAAPQPKASAKAAPVRYDPAFRDIAGTWVSEVGAVGEGRMLRIDVASGGGYSIDVRIPGKPEQVMETGRGNAKASSAGVQAAPDGDTKGAVLKGLGAWRASVADKKSMTLTGADGKRVELAYKGL